MNLFEWEYDIVGEIRFGVCFKCDVSFIVFELCEFCFGDEFKFDVWM